MRVVMMLSVKLVMWMMIMVRVRMRRRAVVMMVRIARKVGTTQWMPPGKQLALPRQPKVARMRPRPGHSVAYLIQRASQVRFLAVRGGPVVGLHVRLLVAWLLSEAGS